MPTRTRSKSKGTSPGQAIQPFEQRKQFAYRVRRHLGEKFQLYAKYNRGINAQDLMDEVLEEFLKDKEIRLPGA